MNDKERALNDLNNYLSSIQQIFDSERRERRQIASDIRSLSTRVERMADEVIYASENSAVGSSECRAALGSAYRKILKAASNLE